MKKFLLPLVVIICTLSGTVAVLAQSNYEPYTFTTLAGNAGYGSADGSGSAARFFHPRGVAVDGAGSVYVGDANNHTIRKITPAGDVSTLAGLAGSMGTADGTGSAARFNEPEGVAVDIAGNVYVADTLNHTIRKISPTGGVSTLAGLAGSMGNADGTGSAARFFDPHGVAVDGAGNVYVADTDNDTIRKISPTGAVSTLAGLARMAGSADGTGSAARFYFPFRVAVDGADNVYVADTFNSTIRKITPTGAVSTLAGLAGSLGSADGTGSSARFYYPFGVAVDGTGNVYVADTFNSSIRKITPAGNVSTLAGAGSPAQFNGPEAVAADGAGNVYVADTNNNIIRKITPAGNVSTLAGSAGGYGEADGTGSTARFFYPYGVAVNGAGNVYVADSTNDTIRKITPAGNVSTLAGFPQSHGSTDGSGSTARFSYPEGVAVASGGYILGNIYVADTYNSTIRKITLAGDVSTLAGLAGNTGSTDGMGSAARFFYPYGVAVDNAGNVYVADYGNSTIRKISPAGAVSTLAGLAGNIGSADGTGSAARFNVPSSVAVDGAGNVYVADTNNYTIRKITPAGDVSTLAGLGGITGSGDGLGSAARFNNPRGVAVDSAGNVYVADLRNHTIRKITPAGDVSTLAGLAGSSGSADGTGSAARFNEPGGVAVDSAGNVYVADTSNHTIRVGTPVSENCTICHKGVQTLTVPCDSLEYRRHKDHGDSDGPCTGTRKF